MGWVVAEVLAGRSPSVALHRYQNYSASASTSTSTSAAASPSTWFGSLPLRPPSPRLHVSAHQVYQILTCVNAFACVCSACSYDAPVGTDVLSLLRKESNASRFSTALRTQTYVDASVSISLCA